MFDGRVDDRKTPLWEETQSRGELETLTGDHVSGPSHHLPPATEASHAPLSPPGGAALPGPHDDRPPTSATAPADTCRPAEDTEDIRSEDIK